MADKPRFSGEWVRVSDAFDLRMGRSHLGRTYRIGAMEITFGFPLLTSGLSASTLAAQRSESTILLMQRPV